MNTYIKSSNRLLILAILLSLFATSYFSSIFPAKATAIVPKTALMYGDSLTFESMWEINAQFKLKTGWTNYIHSYPGTAPCDWLTWLQNDLDKYHPSVVGIETATNYTRPCMQNADGTIPARGSQVFYNKYRADLNSFFSQVTATGAKVVYIKAPPMLDSAWNNDINQVATIATQLAGQYHGVSISTSPRNAVSSSGKYQAYKPCLTTETVDMGCDASTGKIPIRTNSGLQAGIHFCPAGLSSTYPQFCETYSSGEFRFGKSVTNTLVSPPKPVLL